MYLNNIAQTVEPAALTTPNSTSAVMANYVAMSALFTIETHFMALLKGWRRLGLFLIVSDLFFEDFSLEEPTGRCSFIINRIRWR